MPEEVRVSVFGPDLMRETGYEPFFYTRHFLYDYEGSKGKDLFWEENLKEWESCLGHDVKRSEIDHFLSDIPYEEFEKASSFVFEPNLFRNTDLYRISRVSKYLVDNEENEVLAYFFYAKAAERLVNPQDNKHSWKGVEVNEKAVRSLISEMQGSYRRIADPLLKMRYAYQMVMLSRYIGDYSKCINIYDKQIAPHQQSSQIRWLALLHKATALARVGRLNEANLAFAKVFENSPGRRARGFMGFNANHADTTNKEGLSPHDQGLILAMQALKHPGPTLDLIQQVQELMPGHEMLSLLLIREINKLEDWILTPRFTGYATGPMNQNYWEQVRQKKTEDYFEKNKAKDLAYAKEVLEWTSKLVAKGQEGSAIWVLGNAHLAFLLEDFKRSQYWLNAFNKLENTAPELHEQADVTAMLSFVRNRGESDMDLLQRLYPLLQELENRVNYEQELKNNPWFVSRKAKLFGHCLLGLASRMEAEGKKDLAAILMAKVKPALADGEWTSNVPFFRKPATAFGQQSYPLHANYNHYLYLEENADIATVEKLLKWASSMKLSDWEAYFLQYIIKSKDRIRFSLSRMYIREGRIPEALRVAREIDESLWKSKTYSWYLKDDPFQSPLAPALATELNPAQILEKMIAFQKRGNVIGPEQADQLEALGNAYYNMTYYGNHWIMYRCWQSGTEAMGMPPAGSQTFAADYYGCVKAKSYYQKAFNASGDSQQKARLLLLMACCEEKNFAWQNRDLKYQERQLPVGRNPFYKQLKADFQSEKEFILSQCDRLKYYL